MAELLPGRVPPFDVAAGYHPIIDYRFVNAGQPRWVGADGKPIHYWETADPDEIRAEHANVPRGIELLTQPAERSDPILTCTEPWEYNNGGPAIIRDGGLYRMWYHAIAPGPLGSEGRAIARVGSRLGRIRVLRGIRRRV